MDPICQKKYNFLQKYVPFLANLIELLAKDNEKQGKLAQMQLLYDLLNKPDNSVKIETLEKCEEVLCRVFGNKDENIAEVDFVMPSPLIKSELPDEADNSMDQIEDSSWENLNGSSEHQNDNEPSTTLPENNHTEVNQEIKLDAVEQKEISKSEEKLTNPEDVPKDSIQEDDSQKDTKNETNSIEEDQKEVTAVVSNDEVKNDENSTNLKHDEVSVNETDLNNEQKEDEPANNDKSEEQAAKQPESESDKTDSNLHGFISNTQIVETLENNDENPPEIEKEEKNNDLREIEEKNDDLPEIEEKNNEIKDNLENGTPNQDEENIDLKSNEDTTKDENHSTVCTEFPEDVKDSQENEDEPSVKECPASESPNSTELLSEKSVSTQNQSDSSIAVGKDIQSNEDLKEIDNSGTDEKTNEHNPSTEEQIQEDVIKQSPTEMLSFKIVSAESLATTITDEHITAQSNDNTAKEVEKKTPETDDPLDPLRKSPEKKLEKSTKKIASTSSKPTTKEEDDDDVLLVESRSSPICLDSDPEDEENMKRNRSSLIIPAKLPTPRPKPPQPKPSVRKPTSSTAVMESIRKIMNKNHQSNSKRKLPIMQMRQKPNREVRFVKKDPKALMETIDLLDSDSDDERSNNNSKRPKPNSKTDDDVIIVSSSQPQRKLIAQKLNRTVPAPKQIPRLHSKFVNKSPPKATAQSNFLNAVNLQPTKNNSSNPASFSARLSNKKVIIPNAFYGNPLYNRKSSISSNSPAPSRVSGGGKKEESSTNESAVAPPTRAVGVHSGVSIRHVQDKVLKEWLEGFLTNFASPLQIASHACFVLLQRVLKYKFFQRLKETRLYLNQAAKNCSSEGVDVQMLLDLRNVFLDNDYLTEAGRRFCRFATNDAFGKTVALTTDARTGRVTCRTRLATKGELPSDLTKDPNNSLLRNSKLSTPDKPPVSTTVQSQVVAETLESSNSKSSKPIQLPNTSTPSSVPKRRGKFRKLSDGLVVAERDEDDNDYTPTHDEIQPEAEIVTERKRSLRTNRTKRKEAGFTYSEDHDDEEFEAIARKIEKKKLEELRLVEERELEIEREQLEQQRKMVKKTVAKKTTARNDGPIDTSKGPTRKKLRLANTSIVGSEDNDLLTPTWIEADGEDDEVDSLLDFADDPESPNIAMNSAVDSNNEHNHNNHNDEINDELSQDPSELFDIHTDKYLRNIDRNLHLHSKTYDFCVHCQKKAPRIVHHYVNEHRSSEVFPSRLRNRDVRRLLTTSNVGFVHLYKGNQIQYAAHCIFCDKEAKFLLPYWFEHFTMHTGEYSFKCSGCHILKPTRSLLTNHITSNSGCPKKGSAIRLHNFDTKVHQIEAHICSICNYVQIHRKNVLRHLRTQHGLDTISTEHIIKVVLLQISKPVQDQDSIQNEDSQLALVQDSDDEGHNNSHLEQSSLMMQHDFTDNDDLSFMICGMLDVQTNLNPTG